MHHRALPPGGVHAPEQILDCPQHRIGVIDSRDRLSPSGESRDDQRACWHRFIGLRRGTRDAPAQHRLPPFTRHRAIRPALRPPGHHPEHPAHRRSGAAVQAGVLGRAIVLGQPCLQDSSANSTSRRARTSSATTMSSTSTRPESPRSRQPPWSCSEPSRLSRSFSRLGSSKPTASSFNRAPCATRRTARHQTSCPTPPPYAPTWRRSRPAPGRSTRVSARSCTVSTRPAWPMTRSSC